MIVTRHRKELSVTVDMYIQSVNGTSGTFLAVLVGPGGCQVSKYHGIFFTIFPTNSSFVVSADIGKSAAKQLFSLLLLSSILLLVTFDL